MRNSFLKTPKHSIYLCLLIVLNLFGHASFSNSNLGLWLRVADFGGTARQYAVAMAIDSLGYVGLGADSAGLPRDFWRYNPHTNTWNTIPEFPLEGRTSAIGFSFDSVGYVGTGLDSVNFTYDLWEFNPSANNWFLEGNLPGSASPRTEAIGLSAGRFGYISTGAGGASNYFNDMIQYDCINGVFQNMNPIGNPPIGRFAATGFVIGSYVYIGTGIDDSTYFKDFWQYDPSLNAWTQVADFGGTARFGAVGFSTCNYGYVGLGEDLNASYRQDFWRYDPAVNAWSFVTHFPGTGRRSAVAFTINNRAYIGCGWDENGRTKDFYMFSCDSTSGTNDLASNTISSLLFPNPNDGKFEINYDLRNFKTAKLFLTDITGKNLATYDLSSQKGLQKVDIAGLKDGIYFYYIRNGDMILHSGRFFIGN